MKNKTDNQTSCKKTSIGGQALIEGLIMLGPEKKAMATRGADGQIKLSVSKRSPIKGIAKIPFIRGPVRLISQMAVGITALIESAELAEFAAEEPSTDLPESSDTFVTETGLQNDCAAVLGDVTDRQSAAAVLGCVTGQQRDGDVILGDATDLQSDDTGVPGCASSRQSDCNVLDLSGSVDVPKLVGQPEPATVASSINYSQTDEINDVSSTEADDLEILEIPGGAVTSGVTNDLEGIEVGGEAVKSGKFDAWLERHSNLVLWGMVVVALGFSVVFFILLPSLLTDGLRALITWLGGTVSQNNFFLSLIEGIIRITIFVLYLWFASRMEEIKRVWMYHGSEHKAIAAYEAGEELTVENVRKHSRFHPRCGTAFMFLVMVVSILVFALVGRHGPLINLLLRLLLLPIVTAISYELIRLAGRFDNPVTRFVSLPGLAMQRFTTAEPDDSMLEVAIAAIMPVIPEDPGSDQW